MLNRYALSDSKRGTTVLYPDVSIRIFVTSFLSACWRINSGLALSRASPVPDFAGLHRRSRLC